MSLTPDCGEAGGDIDIDNGDDIVASIAICAETLTLSSDKAFCSSVITQAAGERPGEAPGERGGVTRAMADSLITLIPSIPFGDVLCLEDSFWFCCFGRVYLFEIETPQSLIRVIRGMRCREYQAVECQKGRGDCLK